MIDHCDPDKEVNILAILYFFFPLSNNKHKNFIFHLFCFLGDLIALGSQLVCQTCPMGTSSFSFMRGHEVLLQDQAAHCVVFLG